MGLFDDVIANCPHCHSGPLYFQSKAGDCSMQTFCLDAVPVDIARDIDQDIVYCEGCKEPVRIEIAPENVETVRMRVI